MKTNSENGSVLIYILIAVILFGALSFAVSQMMRGGTNIGSEKGGIYASEILTYASALREAVRNLKISNGCDDAMISFERSPFDGSDALYTNSSAPSDFSCHVFHPDGGGTTYQEDFEGHNWRFTPSFAVDDVGTVAQELSATVIVDKAVCDILNSRLDVSDVAVNTPTAVTDGSDGSNVLPAFDGAYNGSSTNAVAQYVGKPAGCYISNNSDGDDYTFYQVLIAR